jgi:hypothetical protein
LLAGGQVQRTPNDVVEVILKRRLQGLGAQAGASVFRCSLQVSGSRNWLARMARTRWTRHGKSGLGARLNSGGSPIACALKPFHDLGRIIELICEETNYVTTLSHTRDGAPSQAATRVCKEPACRTQLTDNLTHT